jgi:hypothetical protein
MQKLDKKRFREPRSQRDFHFDTLRRGLGGYARSMVDVTWELKLLQVRLD